MKKKSTYRVIMVLLLCCVCASCAPLKHYRDADGVLKDTHRDAPGVKK